jgi:hypothetical protein
MTSTEINVRIEKKNLETHSIQETKSESNSNGHLYYVAHI